jgi:ubiquinone/menaquinone biosynthesis C-methylase UbiE
MSNKIYYNGISKGYKNLYHTEQKKKIELIKKYLNFENFKILDLGSGDGVINQFLENKNNEIFSCDISEKLLELNPNKKENKFCLNFENEKLPFKDNFFDFTISLSVFQDLNNFQIVKELKRVCKSNSILIISHIKISTKFDFIFEKLKTNFEIINTFENEIDIIYVLKLI